MAVPKRKMSRSNTRKRRSQWKAELTELNCLLHETQQQLVQSEKLASIGQLAAFLSDCANEIILLGIQPASTTPGTRLSPSVRATLRSLALALSQGQPFHF